MDEKAARLEIARLSDNTRAYLQHNLRNPLQGIYGGIETGDMDAIRESAVDLKQRIERAGL